MDKIAFEQPLSYPVPDMPSGLLVDLVLARCATALKSCMLRHRGDKDRGLVYLLIADTKGQALLFQPTRELDFSLEWQSPGLVSESQAEHGMTQTLKLDPDSWFLEIEDPLLGFPLKD